MSYQENQLSHLEKNAERFCLALKGSNDGIWDWDLRTNEMYYSPRWKNMLGYEEHELEQHLDTWKKLVHPDDKEMVLNKVNDYLKGEIDSYSVEMRMIHRDGSNIHVLSRAFMLTTNDNNEPVRLVGTHVDITHRKNAEAHNKKNSEILKKIAMGIPASEVYEAIALMYEDLHPGMRCSMLELHGNKLIHGGAPSLPKEYCDAVNGLEYGENVGSCGTSTYTGKRVVVADIETDPKWKKIKHLALPHGMRCCWSEPIKNSLDVVLGAFGMYYDYTSTPNEVQSLDLESAARLAGIVMERDQTQNQIYKLAYMDELTKLPSRAKFYQYLEKTIKLSSQNNKRFSLLYIDLDDFKLINDSLGHDVGDQLLQAISKRLLMATREIDFVGRLGGDEFCIIIQDFNDISTAEIAEKCIQEISKPLELMSRVIKPTISIGIAHYPEDGLDITSLFKAADVSLYKAKEKGKNQFTFYTPELTQQAEYLFKLEQHLKTAIEKQQFTLAYQPKININSGEILGVEALLRWHHPELGDVAPIEFIAAAERIGMIKPLTEWVLLKACSQSVQCEQHEYKGLSMAVNISPNHFSDETIVPMIKKIIDQTGMNPEKLELEVTESVIQINDHNLRIFKDLKALGIKLAIDDFGSKYSYFASLKHLEVDILKIDKYFVDDITTEEKSLILLKSMIEMGHNLGYEITLEGVETQEQFEIIKKLGCKSAQGFLFSKPIPAKEITQLLKRNKHN
jgi:diguanylate cyclase (GGDEF)-like protein/PAS domain S-box-containing protein